jgi:hypothetical protein
VEGGGDRGGLEMRALRRPIGQVLVEEVRLRRALRERGLREDVGQKAMLVVTPMTT